MRLAVFFLSLLCAGFVFAEQSGGMEDAFVGLEKQSGGRLGVVAIDMGTNQVIQHRANERFPMGCTSKVVGVAALLKKSMGDRTLLQKRIVYTKQALTNWNSITEKHIRDGMTLYELSAAAIRYSDNAAMNLILSEIGGPQGMTLFARAVGDSAFRQDHGWPDEALSGGKGNVFDSTTPLAMARTLQRLAFTDALGKSQRHQLLGWLKGNTTGDKRIRAGIPKSWVVGDKTGTGYDYGTSNDIAILWPPGCQPIVMTAFYTSDDKHAPKRSDLLANVARKVVMKLAEGNACIRQAL